MVWIDTHCHLNAEPFSGKVPQIVDLSKKSGVSHILIPAVDRESFADVHTIAHAVDGCSYALGIHPLYVPQSPESDLDVLEQRVQEKLTDPHFVAIGEIGLDFYLPERSTPVAREKQEYFFCRQLEIARRYDLPVLLHTLRSVDTVLKFLRQYGVECGIAHAFNGSIQQ
ncbi:MAG: TatD family hydrolase, partial [Oxalobacter sp.]